MDIETQPPTRTSGKIKLPESPYRTVVEAARYLRLNPRTLNNMRSAGRGPNFHKHGRRVLYHIDELTRWSGLTERVMQAPNGDEVSLFA